MRKHVLWMALVAAAAGIVAGCGSGSGNDSVASGSPPPQAGTSSGTADAFFSEVARVLSSSPDDTEPAAVDAAAASSPDETEPTPLS